MNSTRHIAFNKPHLTGKEFDYIRDAISSSHLSGNGKYTKKCQTFLEERFGFKKTLLTSSCTDALEMAAMLINLEEGDEIIMPSFTFVSTANAFILRKAKIVFADSNPENPNIDPERIESLVTARTRAIVVVHYAGVACDMDKIMEIATRHHLFVIEDAAQAIDSYYKGRALGSIGHLAAFSFHETKNIISGEGGMLAINDERFTDRAEIIWEKGTNRAAFQRGEAKKYKWVDLGSSFLPSEMIAAFLWAQLENLENIQQKRLDTWERYYHNLQPVKTKGVRLPFIPSYATRNGHLFYLLCPSSGQRDELLRYLNEQGINAVFHYLPLHDSPFYRSRHDGRSLDYAQQYADRLIRLPLFFDLSKEDQNYVTEKLLSFFDRVT